MTTADRVDDLDTLDPYAEQFRSPQPSIAASVDATALRLVWSTIGFSVPSDRAADYLRALGAEEIACWAHLPLPETSEALEPLIEDDHLEPLLWCCPGKRHPFRLHASRTAAGSFHEQTVIDGVEQSP